MKRSFYSLILMTGLAIAAFGQTPGTSQYPTSLDTNTTLLTAANACSTILNGAINSSVTSITVNSQTCFPSTGVFAIESEYFIYTASTSTTFTVTRGAFGSAAASHATATPVRLSIIAAYHNVLKSGLIATQTKLGSGSDTAAANEVLRGTGSGTSDWGQISNSHIATGAAITISKLSITGTPDGSKFLRDDGSWQTASGTGITALTGDVTASGSGSVAATIANDAVTYAKMQNVSAASKLLGRGDSGSGDTQEITLGSGLTMTGTTLSASGGGGSVWSALTDPSGNLSLAMAANLTTFTWAGNYSTSSAFKIAGSNTSATGSLVEFSSGVANNMPVLTLKPRGGRSFEADKLGSLLLGKDSPGNTDADGYAYLGVIGSNLFPSGTPTSNTGFAPITLQSNGIAGDYSIWGYMGSAWRDLGGQHKRYDTSSGNGAQTIDFNSSTSAVVTRQFTASGGNATLTFSNAPKAGTLVIVTIIQDGTGSRTITWPASVKWPGGTAPTLTTTASKRDVFSFVWDGSNYYAVSQTLNL